MYPFDSVTERYVTWTSDGMAVWKCRNGEEDGPINHSELPQTKLKSVHSKVTKYSCPGVNLEISYKEKRLCA